MKILTNSGLPVKLTDDNKLNINGLAGGDFSKRVLSDLKDVITNTSQVSPGSREEGLNDRDLYYMYRNLHKVEHDTIIRENHLRYDMTVILPGQIGKEYTKTLGHYHPDKNGTNLSYPEVYEVISGRAFYLLQKPKRLENGIIDYSVIENVLLVEVNAGEKAIMPSDYGHITINIDPEPLVMSNWVSNDFQSDYSEYKNLNGGAYYLLKDDNTYQTKKNSRYLSIADIKIVKPHQLPEFGLVFGRPMYDTVINNFSVAEYLNYPYEYKDKLYPDSIYK